MTSENPSVVFVIGPHVTKVGYEVFVCNGYETLVCDTVLKYL